MLTPQDVSSKTFPKAVMGGYAMVSVDEFLDKLTEDYTGLYKENVALKAKIKLLAEKMDESRQTEESFRSLLLSAQKMATELVTNAENERDEIMRQAEAKRSALIGGAEAEAKKRMEELRLLVAEEEKRYADKKQEVDAAIAGEEYRLERARTAVGKFMDLARSSCQEQLQILDKLTEMLPPAPQRPAEPEAPVPAPPPPAEEEKAPEEQPIVPPPAEPAWEEPEPIEEEDEPAAGGFSGLKGLFRRGRAYEEEEDEDVFETCALPIWKINLDDLQFGRNYNKE